MHAVHASWSTNHLLYCNQTATLNCSDNPADIQYTETKSTVKLLFCCTLSRISPRVSRWLNSVADRDISAISNLTRTPGLREFIKVHSSNNWLEFRASINKFSLSAFIFLGNT